METQEVKRVKQPKNRPARENREQREAITIPADATMHTLAKAMWMETKLSAGDGSKEKIPGDRRSEMWKGDKKEYLRLARKVINRVGRLAGKGERGARSASGAEADASLEP